MVASTDDNLKLLREKISGQSFIDLFNRGSVSPTMDFIEVYLPVLNSGKFQVLMLEDFYELYYFERIIDIIDVESKFN